MLKHFSLFTGIGGIDLAAEWAGFETVGQCEWADYQTKILEKHWPDVPRWRDIRDVTSESVRSRGIRTVDLISGGFPCQPFSIAGKQRGEADDRYLWPEMLRVISELKPTWVIGENVPGIINMALEQVCSDLENEGYEVQPFIIPAAGVGALHRRKRVFILGHSKHDGLSSAEKLRGDEKTSNERWEEKQEEAWKFEGTNRPVNVQGLRGCEDGSKQTMAYSNSERLERRKNSRRFGEGWEKTIEQFAGCCEVEKYWDVEPSVGRVADGIPHRVDRIKCLGNAVVPMQIYPILEAIAEIESMR